MGHRAAADDAPVASKPTAHRLPEALNAAGYTATIVPGPLLLATSGGVAARPTVMPLAISSVFTPTKKLLTLAAKRVADELGEDPDLDVENGQEATWTTHSLRRGASTSARRHREKTGTSEAEIDIYFGWHEKILLKEMQNHYAAFDIRERMQKAKITKMI